MRFSKPLAAALLCLWAPAIAVAQSTLRERHVLTPDDDGMIENYVVRDAPVQEFHQTQTPGSVVPQEVPLKMMPSNADPKLQGYAYFVSVDNKVVVVEADTRRVVRILGGG